MNAKHMPFVRFFGADGAADSGGAAPAASTDGSGVPAGATLDDVLSGKVAPANNLPPDNPPNPDGTKNQQAGEKKEGAKATVEQPPAEPKPADVLKNIEDGLFGAEKPEDREKRYEASSKEAVRLNKYVKKVKDMLAEQGIDLADEDGSPKAFIPKKGAKSADVAVPDYEKLPPAIQESFSADPKAAIEHIWKEAQKALLRVTPDEKYVAPISDERKAVALESVKGEKTIDGEAKYPDFDKYAGMAEAFLAGPKAPQALKDLRSAHPELALKIALAVVKHEMDSLSAVVRRKEEKNKKAIQPPLGPSSPGMASEAAQDYANRMGDAIANASI